MTQDDDTRAERHDRIAGWALLALSAVIAVAWLVGVWLLLHDPLFLFRSSS